MWVMAKFDAATLGVLRNIQEVRIRTEKHPRSAVVIWIVVVGEEVFVRSFLGAKGRWYRDVAAGGRATLEASGREVAVKTRPANDPAMIERVSRAFLEKYRSSPYAHAMVQADALPTTLRLQPG
jgi:hypothetical protein